MHYALGEDMHVLFTLEVTCWEFGKYQQGEVFFLQIKEVFSEYHYNKAKKNPHPIHVYTRNGYWILESGGKMFTALWLIPRQPVTYTVGVTTLAGTSHFPILSSCFEKSLAAAAVARICILFVFSSSPPLFFFKFSFLNPTSETCAGWEKGSQSLGGSKKADAL